MRGLFIMASFLSLFCRLFGGESPKQEYKTAEVYEGLRRQVLQLKAEQLSAATNQHVLALLMETGYPEAVVTLVAIVDGSASLYFSSGGGIIGAGENPEPNAAARHLVAKAADFTSACVLANGFPLPQKAHTRFYIVTQKGVLTAEAKEDDLGNGRHRMSPLFHMAHELITKIRLTEEKRKAQPQAPSDKKLPRK